MCLYVCVFADIFMSLYALISFESAFVRMCVWQDAAGWLYLDYCLHRCLSPAEEKVIEAKREDIE